METRREEFSWLEDEASTGEATNICIKDVVSFHDAEKMMYCRLCATVNNDAVSIFGEEGVRMNLADKINVALPIWVSSNMGPPLHVCRKCIASLDNTVDFINQVVAAQKKINTVFKVLQDISKRNLPTAWNRDRNMPSFITYFRAKNFKKLNRMANHENEKENEGGKNIMAVSHTPKKADDSVSSWSMEKSRSIENKATTSEPACVVVSDGDSVGGEDVRGDFDEPVEDDVEMIESSSTNQVVACQEDCTSSNSEISTKSSKEVGNICKLVPKKENGNICKYCYRSFKWNAELLFHHTSAHQDVVFCCRVCFKVFYDDKEEFKKHVKSHSVNTEADSTEVSHENTPSDSDANNLPSVENSYSTLSQSQSQDQGRLNYICKYCSKKYSKLHDLFSHQTGAHSDLVFRCTYCSKVFYENEEELHKHEESHGVHRQKFKSSEGDDADHTQTMKHGTMDVYSSLTEKQQEWVNKILSDGPKKKPAWYSTYAYPPPSNNSCANISPTVNSNDSIPTFDNVNAKFSPTVNSSANISPPVNANAPPVNANANTKDTFSSSANSSSVKLDNQVEVDDPVAMSYSESISVRVVSCQNITQSAKVPFQKVKTYMCRPCQVEFKTEEERDLHRLFHHRLKLPCRFCPRTLAYKTNLLEHEATHFKKPKIMCKKCEEEFDDLEKLKKHKRNQCGTHTLPRFSCQICKRLYIRESELKIHLETHLDERPFLCEKCGQCFKDVSSLMEHRSTPCKSRGFTRGFDCDICEKKFHNARLLASHRIRQHRAMYPCPLCGLIFRSRPTMSNHMMSHSKIICLVCDEAFEALSDLQSHRKKEHPEEEMTEFSAFQNIKTNSVPRLMCEVCDKCFATERTLNAHKAIHLNKAAWQCHLCDEKFDTKVQLEDHMTSHPGERPHKCSICDKTFTFRKSLHQHEKLHFQEKFNTCERCEKSFPTIVELSKHMAVHSSYNAFKCTFCPMSFSRKISLLIHQRTHTIKVYSCAICSKNFSQRKLAEEHEKSHTRNNKEKSVISTGMSEDSLAASLLNMSETILEVSSVDHVLEEVISSANVSSDVNKGGKERVESNIIIDPEYSEVVYVSNAVDDIL